MQRHFLALLACLQQLEGMSLRHDVGELRRTLEHKKER